MGESAASGRWLRAALVLGGAGLFAVLVWKIGPDAIVASFGRLGWRLLIVLVFPFSVITACDTLGWRFAFRRDRVSFLTLVRASLPSVIVAKTTMTIAQTLFLLLGILVASLALPARAAWLLKPMSVLLGVEILAVGGFVDAQMSGLVAGGGKLLERMGIVRSTHHGLPLRRIDRSLSLFYRRQPARLGLSIGFPFLGWVMSAVETWFILWLLGVPVSPATAVIIEACGTAVRFVSF